MKGFTGFANGSLGTSRFAPSLTLWNSLPRLPGSDLTEAACEMGSLESLAGILGESAAVLEDGGSWEDGTAALRAVELFVSFSLSLSRSSLRRRSSMRVEFRCESILFSIAAMQARKK